MNKTTSLDLELDNRWKKERANLNQMGAISSTRSWLTFMAELVESTTGILFPFYNLSPLPALACPRLNVTNSLSILHSTNILPINREAEHKSNNSRNTRTAHSS